MTRSDVTPTPWTALRGLTPARIALGRAGSSLPTAAHLEFQLAHARARKAVHLGLDLPALRGGLADLDLPVQVVASAATDRAMYLQRPDLGRQLDATSRAAIAGAGGGCDLAIVVADGLSALAIQSNAAPFLSLVVPMLRRMDLSLGPLIIATQARVAIGDEIGAALGARMVLVLIGERPGLSSPDSMGLYLTHDPKPGRTDEARNCVSNVRAAGLSYPEAAQKLIFLITRARQLGLTGIQLKDEAEPLATTAPRRNFLIE